MVPLVSKKISSGFGKVHLSMSGFHGLNFGNSEEEVEKQEAVTATAIVGSPELEKAAAPLPGRVCRNSSRLANSFVSRLDAASERASK